MLIAIEGADGVGKATAAAHLREIMIAHNLTATVVSFPRYKNTTGGVVLGHFLAGQLPVKVTPEAAAVLYALDRFESAAFLNDEMRINDVVILDRYIASNMVYQASKVSKSDMYRFMEWILDLEVNKFGMPIPTINILLDTPFVVSRKLMTLKTRRSYTDLKFDEHEADTQLQYAVRENYKAIAKAQLGGAWAIVDTMENSQLRSPTDIASQIFIQLRSSLMALSPDRPLTIRSQA